MHSHVAFTLTLLGVCLLQAVFCMPSYGNPSLTQSQVEELCANMKKANAPMRCAGKDEDFGRFGRRFISSRAVQQTQLQPVVLVPGFGGSALEARLHKQDSPAWYCFKRSDWFRLWLSLSELFVQDCWADNLKTSFYVATNTYNNTYGVDIRGMDFGGTDGIDYLDKIFGIDITFTSVYATIIQSLEAVGYESGVNLRGVPYDFRLPPDAEGSQLYDNIQQLIEETYQNNGNTSVHVITHSMGGPLFLYFLNGMTSAWKKQYIASFIPIAGPWAGSPKALRGLISGDNFGMEIEGISLANKLKLRDSVREAGGLVMLVPDPLFWEDQIFVYTPTKNYTASDIHQLFVDIGSPITAEVYDSTWKIIPSLSAPGVSTYCLYGINQPTEFYYHYNTANYNADPDFIDYSDLGDGTVPERSLKECNTWQATQTQPVTISEFDTSDHSSILDNEAVIQYILQIVTGQQ